MSEVTRESKPTPAGIDEQASRGLVALTARIASDMVNSFRSQSIPKPVKMVAAVFLVGAVVHLSIFFCLVSTAPFAPLAIALLKVLLSIPTALKVLLGIAMAHGLLNLSEGWRVFSLVILVLGVLVIPFCLLVVVSSSEFALLVSQLIGINSWAVKLGLAAAFAMFLLAFVTLIRPDVERAFGSGGQQNRQVLG